MRTLEIIAALIVGLVVFVAIKLIGLVLHIALIGAALSPDSSSHACFARRDASLTEHP
jgi:hypothetical protein